MRAPAASWLSLTVGVCIAAIESMAAQPPSRPGASFTAAQAEAGRAAYDATCSGVHPRDLKGSFEAPQLAGANFLSVRGDTTIADLHAYLMAAMPPDSPGGPGAQAMIDILAYILQANGAPAGAH